MQIRMGGRGGGGGGRKAHTGIIHFRMGTDESIRMVHIRMGAETYRHNSNQNREGWKYFKWFKSEWALMHTEIIPIRLREKHLLE